MSKADPFRRWFGGSSKPRLGWNGKPLGREWSAIADCMYNALSREGSHAEAGPKPAMRTKQQSPFRGNSDRLLSPNQYRLLGFLRGMLADGRQPTHREMRIHMGWSTNGQVASCLFELKRKGRIRRPARGKIEVVDGCGS